MSHSNEAEFLRDLIQNQKSNVFLIQFKIASEPKKGFGIFKRSIFEQDRKAHIDVEVE